MSEALINPKLLVWARERVRLDDGAVAAALKVAVEKVSEWEEGTRRPSLRQAERWAQVTHIPFGFLFMSEPPAASPAPPDFRVVDGTRTRALSADFRDLFEDVQFKQDWFRNYRRERGFPALSLVGSVKPTVKPLVLGRLMREQLKITPETRKQADGLDGHYRALVRAAETAGIWVLRSGTVAGNTQRPVPVEEFRGFAVADSMAPLIFVNVRDAVAAQIFTLAHELAHLWLGASGVSDAFSRQGDDTNSRVERLCNAAAAEFLVPQDEFVGLWPTFGALTERCATLAKEFKVSAPVIAIRARTAGLIQQGELDEFLEQQRKAWKRTPTGGGNFYTNALARNGKFFVRAVVSAASSREISMRDAGQLLNMSPAAVKKTSAHVGVG